MLAAATLLLAPLFAAAGGLGAVAFLFAAASLAGATLLVQNGAGVGPLKAPVAEKPCLEDRQVLITTAEFGTEQHGVGAIPRFLDRRKRESFALNCIMLQLSSTHFCFIRQQRLESDRKETGEKEKVTCNGTRGLSTRGLNP